MKKLIIGCDRHPEHHVTVEQMTIKGGYSSFLVKHKITIKFIENQRVLFDLHGHKV